MKEKYSKQGIKRRILSIMLALAMVFTFMPMNSMKVYAAELTNGDSGTCGDGVSYTFNDTDGKGLLTISGTGAMTDYEYGTSPFYNKTNIKQVVIENGVTSVGDNTFYACRSLQSITIPESVTSVGDNTFYGCSGLQSITIPAGVTSIGENAFWYCSSLQSLTIPAGVTSIGESAFYGCFGLTSVIFNGTVGTNGVGIAEDAFKYVGTSGQNKTTLTLPASGITGPADNTTQWKGGYFKYTPAHAHTWTYTVDGATLTAKCTGANDCTVENGKTTGVSLTISASNANYSGSAASITLDGTTAWTSAGLSTPEIKHEDSAGNPLSSAPTTVGTYYATITVDSYKAKVQYTIVQNHEEDTSKYSYNDANHWNPCKNTDCTEHTYNKVAHSYDGTTHKCVCGKIDPDYHEHSYATAWTTDSSYHWHVCEGTGATDDCINNVEGSQIAPHTPGQEATETSPQVCTVCGYVITPKLEPCSPATPEETSSSSSSSSSEKVEEIIIEPVTVKLDIKTVNIEGTQLNSWTAIETSLPTLTSDKLSKANGDNTNALMVNISTKTDKTVPASTVQTLAKSPASGMHVFIGNNDAVTFVKGVDYSKYTGVSFTHFDTITDNGRVIDFLSKTSLNAPVMFHTVVPANKNIAVYKIVDGKEVLVTNAVSTELGRVCFVIDSTATYVLRY